MRAQASPVSCPRRGCRALPLANRHPRQNRRRRYPLHHNRRPQSLPRPRPATTVEKRSAFIDTIDTIREYSTLLCHVCYTPAAVQTDRQQQQQQRL